MPIEQDVPIRLALVTGATGAVGPALVRRLVREGVKVRAVARHDPPPRLFDAGVEFVRADLADGGVCHTLARDVDTVFHLAARLHVADPAASLRPVYERDNVEVTRRLVAATPASAHFVFFSTIDVYGATRPGELADERTPPRPHSMYSETKLDGEREALAHPRATILRAAAVYGSRVKGNYARLVRAIRRGWFVSVGRGTNRRTLVYDADLAGAACIAAHDSRATGAIYNVTDGDVHTVRDIALAIGLAVGRRPLSWALPVAPVRAAAAIVDRSCHLLRCRAPINSSMIDKLQEDFAVSGARLQQELGFRPAFDLRSGWQAAVRDMATQGT
jgi:nucleoside-diphosphate-sugar epimerase